jgi:hypothetical protein
MLARAIPDIIPVTEGTSTKLSEPTYLPRVQRVANSLVVQGKVGSMRGYYERMVGHGRPIVAKSRIFQRKILEG